MSISYPWIPPSEHLWYRALDTRPMSEMVVSLGDSFRQIERTNQAIDAWDGVLGWFTQADRAEQLYESARLRHKARTWKVARRPRKGRLWGSCPLGGGAGRVVSNWASGAGKDVWYSPRCAQRKGLTFRMPATFPSVQGHNAWQFYICWLGYGRTLPRRCTFRLEIQLTKCRTGVFHAVPWSDWWPCRSGKDWNPA